MGTFVAGGADRIADHLSRDYLIGTEWDGRVTFRMAESGAESPDGVSVKVQLRPDVRFHSGEPVTASRVRQILETHQPLMQEVTGIDVEGERTLILRQRRAHGLKLADLSLYAILDDEDPHLRTGPFMIASADGVTRLEPFAGYLEGPPSVAGVEVREYPSQRAAWTAMMRDEINVLHEIDRDAIDFVQEGGSIRAYPLLRPYYIAIAFNIRHPLIGRRAVRRALVEAVDREEVVRNGMRGHGQAAEGPFWPHHWAYAPLQNPSLHNPTAAGIRLETAGLPVRSRAGAMPSRLAFTCLLLEGDSRFERIALVVQRQLSAVGVDMQLLALREEELTRRIVAGSYEAVLFEFVSARTLSFPYQFWHSRTSLLSTGYRAADEALDRMKTAASEQDQRAAVADVMHVMRADPPAMFLAWPRDVRAADRSLDLPYEPDRDVFGTLWRARPVPAALAGR